MTGGYEERLLDTLLIRFQETGLLKARGKQRTDSTHVRAAIRDLNRLELLGETLRATLNEIAVVEPEWLKATVPESWYARYSTRCEQTRLPQGTQERAAWIKQVASDGRTLLEAIYSPAAPFHLRDLPKVNNLRLVWLQQLAWVNDEPELRGVNHTPPNAEKIESPYDSQARYARKSQTTWYGYRVHLTETCDEDAPHLILNVLMSTAAEPDCQETEAIHEALREKGLLPSVHLMDGGYIDADLLASIPTTYHVALVGPSRADVSPQAKANQGYDVSHFHLDEKTRTATCPQGQTTDYISESKDPWGMPSSKLGFRPVSASPAQLVISVPVLNEVVGM